MGFLRFLYGFLRVFQNLVFWREVRIRVFTGSQGSPNQKNAKTCFKIYMKPQNSKEK